MLDPVFHLWRARAPRQSMRQQHEMALPICGTGAEDRGKSAPHSSSSARADEAQQGPLTRERSRRRLRAAIAEFGEPPTAFEANGQRRTSYPGAHADRGSPALSLIPRVVGDSTSTAGRARPRDLAILDALGDAAHAFARSRRGGAVKISSYRCGAYEELSAPLG